VNNNKIGSLFFVHVLIILCCSSAIANENIESKNIETLILWNEEVWCKGRVDLVSQLVAPSYTRHENQGTRSVTPSEYVLEILALRKRNIELFLPNDIGVDGNLIWTRWSMRADGPNGDKITGRVLQTYRFKNGKLAETWLVFTAGEMWSKDEPFTSCNISELFKSR
jgi:hypothetical protein